MKPLNGRPRVLKVVKLCVFCNRSIKKGQSAVSKIKDIFEHPKCNENSNGYLGDNNFLERHNGVPRCHLCGWYQPRLDLHIDLHDMTEDEYRNAFGIDDDEKLIAFTEYADVSELVTISKPSENIRADMELQKARMPDYRTATEIKKANPKNKKKKNRRKSPHGNKKS